MEQRITSIEQQAKRADRRSIFVNGHFVLGVNESVVLDLGLHVGQEIDEEELKTIVHAELVSKAKDRALLLLEYRPRSRAEIVRRLSVAGYEEDVIEEVAARLEHLGLIDDAQFAQIWVNHRTSGKAMGRTRIKWELRQKGVVGEIVEEALSSLDREAEFESALRAGMRKWQKDRNTDERKRKETTVSYLRRQGFDWEVINKVINKLTSDSEVDDTDDWE